MSEINEMEIITEVISDHDLAHIKDILKPAKTVHEFNKLLVTNFPFNSYEYKKAMELLRDKMFAKKYPSEYVLVIPKARQRPYKGDQEFFDCFPDLDYNYAAKVQEELPPIYRLRYEPRRAMEYNPGYVQVITCGLVVTADDKYVVLKRKYGVFKDKLTLTMGHCSYTPETYKVINAVFTEDKEWLHRDMFDCLMVKDLKREVAEEIGIPEDKCFYQRNIERLYIEPGTSPVNIDYYHCGFIYTVKTVLKSNEISLTGEPGYNEIVIMEPDEICKIQKGDTDGWLYDYLYRTDIIYGRTR